MASVPLETTDLQTICTLALGSEAPGEVAVPQPSPTK